MVRAVEGVVAIISGGLIIGSAMCIVVGPVVINMRACSSLGIEVVVQEGALDGDNIGQTTGQGIAAIGIGVDKTVVVEQDGFERVGSTIFVDFGRDLVE